MAQGWQCLYFLREMLWSRFRVILCNSCFTSLFLYVGNGLQKNTLPISVHLCRLHGLYILAIFRLCEFYNLPILGSVHSFTRWRTFTLVPSLANSIIVQWTNTFYSSKPSKSFMLRHIYEKTWVILCSCGSSDICVHANKSFCSNGLDFG